MPKYFVSVFDGNVDEWTENDEITSKQADLLAVALEHLCSLNTDDGDPIGPRSFIRLDDYVAIASTFSSGREHWDFFLAVSVAKLLPEQLLAIASGLGVAVEDEEEFEGEEEDDEDE